jgi:hypothetical protein
VTSRAHSALSRLYAFAPWLGHGAVTLGLAVMLVGCGQPVAMQSAAALVPPTATATATVVPTATVTTTATAPIAPAATATPTATATIPPTRAITPTATPRAVPVTVTPTRAATAAPAATGDTVRDEDGVCQLTVPATYKVDSAGDGFDALDDNGFGVLTSAVGRSESPEALAQLLYGNFSAVFTNAQPSAPSSTGDTSRIDFTGALGSNQGKGSVYIKKYGTTACGVSMFTYDEAAVPHATSASVIFATVKRLP